MLRTIDTPIAKTSERSQQSASIARRVGPRSLELSSMSSWKRRRAKSVKRQSISWDWSRPSLATLTIQGHFEATSSSFLVTSLRACEVVPSLSLALVISMHLAISALEQSHRQDSEDRATVTNNRYIEDRALPDTSSENLRGLASKSVHLCPAGKARLHFLPNGITRNQLVVLVVVRQRVRSRADQATSRLARR